jgi:hypothetical protein
MKIRLVRFSFSLLFVFMFAGMTFAKDDKLVPMGIGNRGAKGNLLPVWVEP